MGSNKENEIRSLTSTEEYILNRLTKKEWKYFRSMVPFGAVSFQHDNAPDFIGNTNTTTYLLEHFMLDFCYDGPEHNQSESRRANRDVQDLYTKYHDEEIGTIKDCDMDDAALDLEQEINKVVNLSNKFDYSVYVQEFQRSFLNHYKKISNYLNNSNIIHKDIKVGFLIEFHCDSFMVKARYNGSVVHFRTGRKRFPITDDIINIFKDAKDVDFIILSQYEELDNTDVTTVSIFDPHNIDLSLNVQKIKVYDEVFYERLDKKVSLSVKHTGCENNKE